MPRARSTSPDLQLLSAAAHTPESFGRAIVSASLAAAAEKGGTATIERPIKLTFDVTVTQIPQVGAWVCVGIEGYGRFCRLERQD
jgi:hypothetical protein